MIRLLKRKLFYLFGALLSKFISIKNNRVAFVLKCSVPFSGNVRAMAEALSSIEGCEVVLYKDGKISATSEIFDPLKYTIYSGASIAALKAVLSASTLVLGHSARDAMLSSPNVSRRVINLWHGVAIKRIEHLMRPEKFSYKSAKRRALMRRNSRLYDAMIASSETDRLVNSLAFRVDMDKIHVTGLPRFDYLCPDYDFPIDLKDDINKLEGILAGRKLVLYAPTFREVGPSALNSLEPTVVEQIRDFLRSKTMVLGIRPHPYDQNALSSICDGEWIIDLRPDSLAEAAIALRASSALIVDYSSIWVDYLLLKRPIVGFMPDLAQYLGQERGFIYDFPRIFPGPILNEWGLVIEALNQLYENGFRIPVADQEKHAHADHLLLPPQELRFKSTQACMRIFFGDMQLGAVGAIAKH